MVEDLSGSEGVSGTGTLGRRVRASDRDGAGRTGYTCNGCTETWTALGACHCGACHRTFSGIGLFDRHRDQRGERGKCLDPSTLTKGSPIVFRNGMWRGPEMDEEALTKRRGEKSPDG